MMNKLERLWKLEEHNLSLDRYLKEIDSLNEELKEQVDEIEVKDIEKRIDILNNNASIMKESILKYENTLAQCEYNIETLDNKLYKENITDIKQLEYLSQEKDQMKEKLKTTETEMIAYMEEEEIIKKKLIENEALLDKLKNNSKYEYNEIEKNLKSLDEQIKKEEKLMSEITENLGDVLLSEYNKIRERKKRPIVIIKDNTCLGCNMMLPVYQLEDLKDGNKIINCESCGRILYLKD